MPAIYSPEMAMAGFGMLGDIAPVINYVARLDGVSQYWQLSGDISCGVGGFVRFKYIGPDITSNDFAMVGRENNYSTAFMLRERDGGVVEANAVGVSIDGVTYANGDNYPSDLYSIKMVELEVKSPINISILMAAYRKVSEGLTTWNFPGAIFDFEVEKGGVITNKIPLTNKAQGATQLATVGNVNATMVGYTPDVWEQV